MSNQLNLVGVKISFASVVPASARLYPTIMFDLKKFFHAPTSGLCTGDSPDQAGTIFTLNASNWQLWRKKDIITRENVMLYREMYLTINQFVS